jgi:hypothetical protein
VRASVRARLLLGKITELALTADLHTLFADAGCVSNRKTDAENRATAAQVADMWEITLSIALPLCYSVFAKLQSGRESAYANITLRQLAVPIAIRTLISSDYRARAHRIRADRPDWSQTEFGTGLDVCGRWP